MTPAEIRLKTTIRQLVREGMYPGTTTLCRRLGFHRTRLDLNGREMRWRAEELTRLGWVQGSSRWAPSTRIG